MEQIDTATKTIASLWSQIEHAPSHLLLILVLNGIGLALKWSALPNRFIPRVLILIGVSVYPFLASPRNISPEFRFPELIMGLHGFLLSVGAIGVHAMLKRWDKYCEFENLLTKSYSGDTEVVEQKENV